MRTPFGSLKLSLMLREMCSAAGIITSWTLPSVQTPSPPTTLHPPHLQNALTHQTLLMLSTHYLETMRAVSSVVMPFQGITHLKGTVTCQLGTITSLLPKP